MGRGKAKGWRPAAAGSAQGLLLGSADSCTGDTIASPVQLREEGRALPKQHINYDPEGIKGQPRPGAWKGGKGDRPVTSVVVPAPTAKAPKAQPPEAVASGEYKSLAAEPARSMPPPSMRRALTPPPTKPDAKAPSLAQASKESGKTEIELRREAAAEAEEAAQVFPPLQPLCKEEEVFPPLRPLCKEEEVEETQPKEEVEVKQEAEESAHKRLRSDVNSSGGDAQASAGVVAEVAKPAGNAVQQGLQRWAEKVNGLAGTDADLVKRCREFVRKRILKAHASGSLHATDWDEELVPTVEALREGAV